MTAMQVIQADISNIVFLTVSSQAESRYPGALVELGGRSNERMPMGSFGDGMRRLLTLAIAMIQTSGGMLLIDEIDTGLHYSVMGDLWRFIIQSAKQSNVQVFATTHSLDCVRGLAQLCDSSPDSAAEVSVHRIDPSLDQSVDYSARDIAIAVQQELEVR